MGKRFRSSEKNKFHNDENSLKTIFVIFLYKIITFPLEFEIDGINKIPHVRLVCIISSVA